jgi:hypothetical protein
MSTKYRFQLLRGSHRIGPVYGEKTPTGNRVILKEGYNAKRGDVIDSTVDLAAKFPSIPPKFIRIDVVQEQETDLKSMLSSLDKRQLIAKAEEDEIDISGCHTKDQILNRFLETLGS